jgi:hypothetical protein
MPSWRTILWWVVILFWAGLVLLALIQEQAHLAMVCGILGIGNCFALGYFLGWRYGIRRHVRHHLGCRTEDCVELSYAPGLQERIDLLRVLEEEVANGLASRLGINTLYYGGSLQGTLNNNSEVAPFTYDSFETAPGKWDDLPQNAIYLVRVQGVPAVVTLMSAQVEYDDDDNDAPSTVKQHRQGHLKLLAEDMETCQTLRQSLLERARANSAWRGQALIVRAGDRRQAPVVEFTTIKPVDQNRIILPQPIFDAVERTVLQQMAEAERLRQHGQRTRTAILLFGPPGTGKTLLTRYLVARAEGFTTIQLQGFQRALVRECFRLARYLEPSLIILEDVDLIAVKRQRNQKGTSALHALLDELDGLAPESRCAVVMTTNRPDVLEPALASRPGRVTQAIEFPMPSAEDREKLLHLFLRQVDAQQVQCPDWARKSAGASPAFLEELVRRAVLIALRRQPDRKIAQVNDEDLRMAMQEIVQLGGQLTQQLLGRKEG